MDIVGVGKRVQVFIDEGDRLHGKALYLAILDKLHEEGAAGATVTRGIAGFGAHSRIHTARLADLVVPLPLVITWIDAPDRVERLLPTLCEMVAEGLVTVEDVEIAKYTHRDLAAMRPSIAVGELMTRDVVAVRPDTPIAEVVELLIGRDYRAVPVVAEDGRLVGIVTSGDLVERGGLPAGVDLLGAMDPEARAEAIAQAGARSAGEVMTTRVVATAPDEPIQAAAELMVSKRLKRLPVVNKQGRLIGILSRADLLRALGEAYPAPERREPAGTARPMTVGEIMSLHVPAVREDARLSEVLDAVVSTRLYRAVVIDRAGRVLGIISDADVLDADVLRRLDPHTRSGLLGALMRRGRTVPEEVANTTAAEMMSTPVLTVRPDTPIDEAARRMVEARRKVLPIVDEEGSLLGIVDRAHLLAAATGAAT